jgi:hypothetical protein
MKGLVNNFFNIILLIALILFGSFFMYKSYDSYKRYKIIQKSERSINLIKELNTIIKTIEKEQSFSAVYLGYNGKIDFDQLETIRKLTDSTINNTKIFIQNNPIFTSYEQKLTTLSNSLQYVRSRVDVVNSDYKSILFEYYQNEIIKPILEIIKENLQELALGLSEQKSYIYTYLDFIDFASNINREKSLIAYLLANSKKMSNQDLVLWDKIIEEQTNPLYSDLDIKTVTKLHKEIDSQAFEQSNFKTRVEISKGILNGVYTINSTQWLNTMDKKLKKVIKCENIIYDIIKEKTSNIKVSPKETIINVAIALLSLFLLLYLIFAIKKEKKAKKNFMQVKKRRRRSVDRKDNDDMIDIRPNLQMTNKQDGSFNPIEEFESIISEFAQKADKKHIAINHYIDPTVPTACIGNLKQIKQVISNLLNHAIGTTKSYGVIKVRVENSANKETESAIRFSVIESDGHISREYKNKIMRYFFNEELVKSPKISTRKTDLITTGQLIANMDGIFEISNSEKSGAILSFAVSLKKVNPKKPESLVA